MDKIRVVKSMKSKLNNVYPEICNFEVTHSILYFIIYPSIFSVLIDTVDFTECDPMLRITTLWFSESISPLSETDDVRSTQCFS